MTTILFYFLIVLALAGSSYYGWKSAKSAKNRQETQEQKRLRSVLLFVNVLLFAGFLSLVITILNDAFILTGHEGLLQQGLRMLLGSGVTMKSKGPSLTLFAATVDFLRMVVNIGFLLCLRAFLITYPLEPSQISLISMFTIGIPAFFLALQPNKEVIKGHFLTNVFLKALPAGLTDVLAVGALVVFGQTFGVGAKDISTAATMLLAIVGFMILYKICQPLNTIRVIVWVGSIIGLLACSIFLPDLFAITGMSSKCIMLFIVFSIATEPVLRYLTLLVGGLKGLYKKFFHKA